MSPKTCFHNWQYIGIIVRSSRTNVPATKQNNTSKKKEHENQCARKVLLISDTSELGSPSFIHVNSFFSRAPQELYHSSCLLGSFFFSHRIFLDFSGLKNFLHLPEACLCSQEIHSCGTAGGSNQHCSVVSSPHQLYCHPLPNLPAEKPQSHWREFMTDGLPVNPFLQVQQPPETHRFVSDDQWWLMAAGPLQITGH